MASVDSLREGTILRGKRDYHITSQLGHGGFGITYLAEATIMVDGVIPQKLKFCIKEFYLSDKCSRSASGWVNFNTDPEIEKNGKSDFRAEAEILKSLNAVPGIVPVSDIFEANNTVYYVMQFLEGQTLDKKIQTENRLTETEALSIIEKIGRALMQLHDKKMTHLDIKPENIILVKEGFEYAPVLIDFGLSRCYNMFGRESRGKKVFAISEGYSPVEQYGIINSFTPESDVYALAATLFHMLTGEVPKPSKDVTDNYIRETLLKYGVSEKVVTAITRAMRRESNERTESVRQFLNDLKEVQSGGGKETEIIGPNPSNDSHKYYKIFGIAALIALVGFFAFSILQNGNGGEGSLPKANLNVICETPDADIYINDVKKGTTPWSGNLDSGDYKVEVRKKGFESQSKSITLAEKETIDVKFPSLVALPPTPIPTGHLTINYQPRNSEVWIDGKKRGTTPSTFKDLPIDTYSVEIRKNGYENKNEQVTIVEGQTKILSGNLTKVETGSNGTSTGTSSGSTSSNGTLQIGDYATWRGDIKNGKPHGRGTMTFTKSHLIDSYCDKVAKAGDTVEGTYVDGHLHDGMWQSDGQQKYLLIGN